MLECRRREEEDQAATARMMCIIDSFLQTKTTQLDGVEPIVDHRVRSRLQLLESDYALDIHLGRFASNPGVMHFLL